MAYYRYSRIVWYRYSIVDKHGDPANHGFWNPPCLGPLKPHVDMGQVES